MVIISIIIIIVLLSVLFIWQWRRYQQSRIEHNNLEAQYDQLKKELMVQREMHIVKNRIYGILAHDIGTINSAYSDLALKMNFLIERGRLEELLRLADHLDKQDKRGTQLIDSLKEWSQPLSGNTDKHLTVLDDIINTEIAEMGERRSENNISAERYKKLKEVARKITPQNNL